MKRKMELLVPGGDVDCIKAAILAGADAVYCGLDKFNARNRAANINFEDLQGVIQLAHHHHCKIFLTLNIIIIEKELNALIGLLNKLVNTKVDGIIVQDLGLLYILSHHYPSLQVHASTQLTTHNEGQIKFLSKLNVNRVNLSRELSIHEIKYLSTVAKNNQMFTEVFVHGSNCLSFSGLCYMSSYYGGNSGNRGRCSQPCRDKYVTTKVKKEYPLNLKDNAAYNNIGDLQQADVYSLKIEGRIKKYDYIYTVVNAYRKQIDHWCASNKLTNNSAALYKVFNRDFSNAYLTANISKDMFIDNPRDHSIKRLSEVNTYTSSKEKERAEKALYDEKDKIKATVEDKIKQLSIKKIPLEVYILGECGARLHVRVKTSETVFDVYSKVTLTDKGTEALSYSTIFKRLKAINDTEFDLVKINLDGITDKLYLPFKELSNIKKQILYILNDSKAAHTPIQLPALGDCSTKDINPSLSIVISSLEDLQSLQGTDATIYFQLPSNTGDKTEELANLFTQDKTIIPWFPALLIGDDYKAAIAFIERIKPNILVTDNTGIAFEAYEKKISWVAGPALNLVNSYSLLCLKEIFNCSGAFISNEISKNQIKGIKKPHDFKLFYSIYHPSILMTTRQCLFQQVTGCYKSSIDEDCVQSCAKSTTITNAKGISFGIEKNQGNYQRVYAHQHYLNTEIVKEIPQYFDAFTIDLSQSKTETKVEIEKTKLISHFEEFISGSADADKKLHKIIYPTLNTAYKKGI